MHRNHCEQFEMQMNRSTRTKCTLRYCVCTGCMGTGAAEGMWADRTVSEGGGTGTDSQSVTVPCGSRRPDPDLSRLVSVRDPCIQEAMPKRLPCSLKSCERRRSDLTRSGRCNPCDRYAARSPYRLQPFNLTCTRDPGSSLA